MFNLNITALPMRRFHNNFHPSVDLIRLIKQHQVNALVLIPAFEDLIKMESISLSANKLIGDESAMLQCEKKIDAAETLLSLLRRAHDRS